MNASVDVEPSAAFKEAVRQAVGHLPHHLQHPAALPLGLRATVLFVIRHPDTRSDHLFVLADALNEMVVEHRIANLDATAASLDGLRVQLATLAPLFD